MDRARYIAALVFVGLATVVALGNWLGALLAVRRQRRGDARSFSFAPLFSILLSGAAYGAGHDSLGATAWLPALIDPATWVTAWAPLSLLTRRRRRPS